MDAILYKANAVIYKLDTVLSFTMAGNYDILSVSEPEQAELIHGEGRTIITYLYGASYDIHFGR